jgi:hypothetical protein
MTEALDPRMFGMHTGTVFDDADPKGLARVRVMILGLCEPASAWAWPFGLAGAGGADRGGFIVPPKGADVVVFFKNGDIDHPFYAGGNFGLPGGVSEVPTPAKMAGAQAHKVAVLETDLWRVSMDSRPTSPYLVVENKTTGDKIEIDGLVGGVQIDAKVALILKCIGAVNIQGLQVSINGRIVRPGTDPI